MENNSENPAGNPLQGMRFYFQEGEIMNKPASKNSKGLRIVAEHSIVQELSPRQMHKVGLFPGQQIIRRSAYRTNKPAYSIAMTLCNLLYPREFVRQIASGANKSQNRVTYSTKTNLSRGSQRAIYSFYRRGKSKKERDSDYLKYARYSKKIKEKSEKRALKILSESGISVNKNAMNIGIGKNIKTFVLFEPYEINIIQTESFIRKMPKGLKKRQAIELLNGLREYGGEYPWCIRFHSG